MNSFLYIFLGKYSAFFCGYILYSKILSETQTVCPLCLNEKGREFKKTFVILRESEKSIF